MSDEELIDELKKDREHNFYVDNACIEVLKKSAKEYGERGKIASDLLDLYSRILDCYC